MPRLERASSLESDYSQLDTGKRATRPTQTRIVGRDVRGRPQVAHLLKTGISHWRCSPNPTASSDDSLWWAVARCVGCQSRPEGSQGADYRGGRARAVASGSIHVGCGQGSVTAVADSRYRVCLRMPSRSAELDAGGEMIKLATRGCSAAAIVNVSRLRSWRGDLIMRLPVALCACTGRPDRPRDRRGCSTFGFACGPRRRTRYAGALRTRRRSRIRRLCRGGKMSFACAEVLRSGAGGTGACAANVRA